MADSPVFDRACDELERRTSFDRLEARGTVRIALKAAGLDPVGVDAEQMAVVLRKVLPEELESRGVENGAEVCTQLEQAIQGVAFEATTDRAGAAAAAVGRFGG